MYTRSTLTASDVEAFSIKDIVKLYYEAVRNAADYEDYEPLAVFKSLFPKEYKHFCKVHYRRSAIHKCIDAMKSVSSKVYFGTLTFKSSKNRNKIETKRKEAEKKLNSEFSYWLMVEEYGEDNGRYHIHFLGVFKLDHDFNSFIHSWHSRQNLRLLDTRENIAQYICKYVVKDLPRVRKNKNLVGLVKHYKEAKRACSKEYVLEERKRTTVVNLLDYDLSTEPPF